MNDDEDDPRLRELAARLHAARPAPHPAFRSRLLRRLAGHGFPRTRPARLWSLVAGFSVSGAALLAVAVAMI